MDDLRINEFQECQQCGDCCRKSPCDLIPANLPPLLAKLDLSLEECFKRYLIALVVALPSSNDESLMMVPVRVEASGERCAKFLADHEYLGSKGQCIFLEDGKCSIDDVKPYGGRFLTCAKMTGTVSIQLGKSQYYAYWARNQHLFEAIFPGYMALRSKVKPQFDEMDKLGRSGEREGERFKSLQKTSEAVFTDEIFPMFNGVPPVGGYTGLHEKMS